MKQKNIGNDHVKEVKNALLQLMEGNDIEVNSAAVSTAFYLFKKHPNIQFIQSKFDFANSDQHPDINLRVENIEIPYHLFKIKSGVIQPRNLGGKSFLSNYFNETKLQEKFNSRSEQLLKYFYNSILVNADEYLSLKEMRKEIKLAGITFANNIQAQKARKNILFSLRENALEIFHALLNNGRKDKIISGLNDLLFSGEKMLITSEKKSRFLVLEKSHQFSYTDSINIYRKGNDSIGFTDGKISLIIRFKFESQPNSPIKLTTSLSDYEPVNRINTSLTTKFETTWEDLISNAPIKTTSDPNSIGKVNEALIYHYFLKNQSTIISDETKNDARHIENLKNYGSKLSKQTLKKLNSTCKQAIEITLLPQIKTQYPNYSVSAISLTDEAYRLDIKDNSDIKILLNLNNSFFVKELGYSLKANAKSSSIPVLKNPGFGTILGPNYFRVGDTVNFSKELKKNFLEGKFNHTQVLEYANEYLANSLKSASIEQLKKGVSTIIGEVPTLHTFYEENSTKLSEVIRYEDDLNFKANCPTSINNSIFWNSDQEQLIMRVKFSGGHSKGWSSLKLACTYKIH